ncbi:MAG: indolepyruvate ferredoxin oxidoreductase [Deltaproteobacteria bacterium]|nr:MAG: indolepyruvate ferredoxin oxidoreductase [Deltaproteobacteria bacterium]
MTDLLAHQEGARCLLMGNEAMARGALEAGVNVAAGYPGTPSSEIIENLANAAQNGRLYVEWSTNEKVALEVAAAASFAGLRSLCVMKQNGVNVASDFLLHLAGSGTRGGMVLVACDDPGALSSVNEGESRHFARLVEIPLLEPGGFQEALDMMKWAFALSEKIRNIVMVRSVTRLSHASGNVVLGPLPGVDAQAVFRYNGNILDPMEGPVISMPVTAKHGLQQKKLRQAVALFDASPFNTYTGPDAPEILCITASAGYLYSKEAIDLLGLEDRVGLLKLGTTWPLPSRLLAKYLALTHQILIVEEVTSFLEDNVKILAAGMGPEIGVKTIFGKTDGTIPSVGELNPDIVIHALLKITGVDYQGVPADYTQRAETIADTGAPARDLTFCPGCPHRASFWSIHMALQMDNRQGFVCGDIGCYSLAIFPTGFSTLKTVHSMGSGTGIASGFGKLGPFGMNQPVLAVCGDSTFFHAVLPALVNAVHQRSEITLVVLDNSGTAMTGFQPHPGLSVDASGNAVPGLDIARICEAIGAGVRVCDPFDLETTRQTLFDLLESRGGVNVLILKKRCALSPERKARKDFKMSVDQAVCLGSNCGCNRLCTRIFRCPGLIWNKEKKMTEIDEVICVGCGVCASICPSGAVVKKEKA